MAGKVEAMMCLMFAMPNVNDESANKINNGDLLFQMIQQVLQTNVQQHNYRNCSAR